MLDEVTASYLVSSIEHPASSIPATSIHIMQNGAIILCGGKSSRMGRDKATLPFGPELMLQRVVRLVGEIVDHDRIVVVAAATQQLPELPSGVHVVRDEREYRGPLEGLAMGLRTLGDQVDAAYAAACDVPLLVPAFMTQMFKLLGEHDIAVPFDGEYHHPLATVYRPRLVPQIETLLAADRLRPKFLIDEVDTREIPVNDLRDVDPQLATLQNLNHPDDYHAALRAAGFTDDAH
jgi:molybdopterin-guanine dinucleotide biosynthesis protein A